jgi:hypothetical protein
MTVPDGSEKCSLPPDLSTKSAIQKCNRLWHFSRDAAARLLSVYEALCLFFIRMSLTQSFHFVRMCDRVPLRNRLDRQSANTVQAGAGFAGAPARLVETNAKRMHKPNDSSRVDESKRHTDANHPCLRLRRTIDAASPGRCAAYPQAERSDRFGP